MAHGGLCVVVVTERSESRALGRQGWKQMVPKVVCPKDGGDLGENAGLSMESGTKS